MADLPWPELKPNVRPSVTSRGPCFLTSRAGLTVPRNSNDLTLYFRSINRTLKAGPSFCNG
jgi:hypothetical protein